MKPLGFIEMTNETKAVTARKRVRRDFKSLNEKAVTYCRVSIRVLESLDQASNGLFISGKIAAFREALIELGVEEVAKPKALRWDNHRHEARKVTEHRRHINDDRPPSNDLEPSHPRDDTPSPADLDGRPVHVHRDDALILP